MSEDLPTPPTMPPSPQKPKFKKNKEVTSSFLENAECKRRDDETSANGKENDGRISAKEYRRIFGKFLLSMTIRIIPFILFALWLLCVLVSNDGSITYSINVFLLTIFGIISMLWLIITLLVDLFRYYKEMSLATVRRFNDFGWNGRKLYASLFNVSMLSAIILLILLVILVCQPEYLLFIDCLLFIGAEYACLLLSICIVLLFEEGQPIPNKYGLPFNENHSSDKKSEASTIDGETPLNMTSREGNTEVLKEFIASGADINQVQKDGQTMLHLAARKGNIGDVKLLLSKSADVNVQDRDRRTPLHCAIYNEYIDIAKLLIEAGADFNITDKYGWTPLKAASDKGHTEIVELLKQAGGMSGNLASMPQKQVSTTPPTPPTSPEQSQKLERIIEGGKEKTTTPSPEKYEYMDTFSSCGIFYKWFAGVASKSDTRKITPTLGQMILIQNVALLLLIYILESVLTPEMFVSISILWLPFPILFICKYLPLMVRRVHAFGKSSLWIMSIIPFLIVLVTSLPILLVLGEVIRCTSSVNINALLGRGLVSLCIFVIGQIIVSIYSLYWIIKIVFVDAPVDIDERERKKSNLLCGKGGDKM